MTTEDRRTLATHGISRRTLLLQGGALAAGLTALRFSLPAAAFPRQAGEDVLPWLDQPPPNAAPDLIGTQLQWEALDSWRTPTDQFFTVHHYAEPTITEQDWRLEISGLVQQPMTLTLSDLKARPRQELDFTIECSGNTGLPFFTGGIGNAHWAGTPLAALLQEAGVQDRGIEVVFWGTDTGSETVRDIPIIENFARSMALKDALDPQILLCYEMNGAPLPPQHGFPLRLLAPGWYGIANTKWLQRIEVRDTHYMGRFMAQDYVTIREEQHNGATVWTFTSVGRARLKSAPAKVTRTAGTYRIVGAAWGAPIAQVEVQIDDGPWTTATLTEGDGSGVTWTFWELAWGSPTPGEHRITSRATDTAGQIQPAPDDPQIATKRTYWESNGQITRRISIPAA
jgi:DMSO/TMAO reductase YedYZ molybdopterin-dependent catalytic subunit